MKRNLAIIASMLFPVLSVSVQECGVRKETGSSDIAPGTEECRPAKSEPLCGGYSESREPETDEYQLFRKVTDKVEGMTFTPLTVQTQVVAGINYRFYCRFCDGSPENSPGHCYLTIYKPLPGQGEPVITSIKK